MQVWVLEMESGDKTFVHGVFDNHDLAVSEATELAEEPLTWEQEGVIYSEISNRTSRGERYYLTCCYVNS